MSEVFETMTKRMIGLYTVRVWRDVPSFRFGDPECINELDKILLPASPGSIYNLVKEIPHVSAIEITDASGQGIVWYKEWP